VLHRQDLDPAIEQSGTIPYRLKDDQIEVLLITSRSRRCWLIPKGWIEPWLSSAESAAREAWEEAGLVGQISTAPVGWYAYRKWNRVRRVEVFLLRVDTMLDDWPEAELRDRQWLSLAEAATRINQERLREIIMCLPELLQSGLK
jgi:8-oxo-dGTP pyrophosphatase MutT (NUDIX family)